MRSSRIVVLAALLLTACGHSSERDASSESSVTNAQTSMTDAVGLELASGAAFGVQRAPAAATNGTAYLAAWSDVHRGPGDSLRSTILASPIGADGAVVSSRSIALPSNADGNDLDPVIASDGKGYLVVWTHEVRAPGDAFPKSSFIAAARIDAQGNVLDTKPIELAHNTTPANPGRADARYPTVAFNGTEYLVAWSDNRDGTNKDFQGFSEIYGARVAVDGSIAGSPLGFRISTTGSEEWKHAAVAATASTFLVAWDELSNVGATMTKIFGARIDSSGALLDATPITIAATSHHSYAPSLASDGTSFFAAWYDYYSQSPTNAVFAARLAADGTRVDAVTIPVSTDQTGNPQTIWDGEAYVVAWPGGARRFSKDGAAIDTKLEGKSGNYETRPALASNGSSLFTLRTDYTATLDGISLSERVGGTLFAKAGGEPTKSGIYPARGDAAQRQLASAFDGKELFAVWQEFRGDDRERAELWGAFFGADGKLADTKPFRLRGSEYAPKKPVVVFNGTEFVVAWEENQDSYLKVVVARVTATGASPGEPIVVNGAEPNLAVGGGHTLLLVNGDRGYFLGQAPIDQTKPALQRYSADAAGGGPNHALVWDGSHFVIAWIPSMMTTKGVLSIFAQRFSATGKAIEATPIHVGDVPVRQWLSNLAAATDGNGKTLIVWDDLASKDGGVWGARIGAGGLIDASPARVDGAKGALHAYRPTIAFDGIQWLVGYETGTDYRASSTGSGLELARVRFTPAGVERLGDAVAFATAGANPSIAAGPAGQAFVGYESIAATERAVNRIAMRVFTDAAGPPIPDAPGATPTKTPTGSTSGADENASSAPETESPPSKRTPTTTPPSGSATETSTTTTSESSGCSASPASGSTGAPLVLLVLGALVMRRRRED